ncbi:MAG TPA: TIGR04222 domain-containing membrane protein, partial [Planctomycetota bacterium]|nr:TIGR04222 domain-containing membrane protein [Planctomycetota bacterium]
MNERETALFREIEQFPLEDQPGPFPFSHRLARENGWSLEYAERVIGEYRKFLFLAAVSGKEVSPSDAVDQAWHLHLVYSRSYWDRLCTKVLKRPFHHEPARGGDEEKKRFQAAYLETLELYRSLLGQEPPEDIWARRPSEAESSTRYERVDREANLVIPRSTFKRGILTLGTVGTALLALALTASWWQAQASQVFDLRGPEFLALYGVMFLSIVAGGLLFRRSQREPEGVPSKGTPDLGVQELAFLSGGEVQVIQTALTSLLQKEALAVVPSTFKLFQKGPLPDDAPHLEKALYRHAGSVPGKTMAELRGSA